MPRRSSGIFFAAGSGSDRPRFATRKNAKQAETRDEHGARFGLRHSASHHVVELSRENGGSGGVHLGGHPAYTLHRSFMEYERLQARLSVQDDIL